MQMVQGAPGTNVSTCWYVFRSGLLPIAGRAFLSNGTSIVIAQKIALTVEHSRSRPPVSGSLVVSSLRHSHQFKYMTVRVLEINASAAIPVIELAIVEAPGSAAI